LSPTIIIDSVFTFDEIIHPGFTKADGFSAPVGFIDIGYLLPVYIPGSEVYITILGHLAHIPWKAEYLTRFSLAAKKQPAI